MLQGTQLLLPKLLLPGAGSLHGDIRFLRGIAPLQQHLLFGWGLFRDTGRVLDHIAEFGKPRVVNFNKGYFSDTLPHFDKSPVMCIWMDVDLFSSARGVAQILDRLPRNSVLFTHEFPHDGAQPGLIIPEKSEVFPPILDRFESLGWNPVGRYLSGYLGAIWDAVEGIPVIPHHCLMNLVQIGE